ncbi:alkaline phosphatase PafA [Chitinophaga pollutisoli]|uniref:Alkaline phosphatase PafA n=1 Tax=Chitinophaga pollutisoli TaxID=3133966 RepID=A0ABZ2YPT4_9BACT
MIQFFFRRALPAMAIALMLAPAVQAQTPPRPKIVVGMMVDQMRWDFLYRYAGRYGQGGFKRLLREGFRCEQTYIDYAPTVTACGHTSVYTGSVPAIHGIMDNGWYSRELGRDVYCTEDSTVRPVGIVSEKGGMSPRNMLTTTVTDELRMATQYQSKVVGVALKDRGSILPAGHAANAAFWYDGSSGSWITSTYYMQELPDWAKRYNAAKRPEKLLAGGWETMYPIATYKLSEADDKNYENKFKHESAPVFPHRFAGQENGSIRSTPFGNTLTFEFAKAAIEGYGLGAGKATDFLAVSFSSPDAVGHQFGPNSIETEDVYLRLDKDLADFFSYLDTRFGKGNWLYFITADHGVSHSPGYLEEHRLPTGTLDGSGIVKSLNAELEKMYGVKNAIMATAADQLYLDRPGFAAKNADMKQVSDHIISRLRSVPEISDAIYLPEIGKAGLHQPLQTMLQNGYNRKRGGDIVIVMNSGVKNGSRNGATHGLWYPYDSHIPLVWMGWGIKSGGRSYRTMGMTDIAPTIAALLNIQVPSGNIGHVIGEAIREDKP